MASGQIIKKKIALLWNQGFLGVGWEKVERVWRKASPEISLRRESEGHGKLPPALRDSSSRAQGMKAGSQEGTGAGPLRIITSRVLK